MVTRPPGTARDRIVASAQQLLAERGYSAMSPRAVLDHSAVGQGSLYHHFADKVTLARTALDRTAAEFQDGWDEMLSAPGTAVERIVSCFGHENDDVTHGCPMGRLTQDEGVMSDGHLAAPVNESLIWLTARIEDVITDGIRSGELRQDTPAAELATAISALIQSCYVLSRASGDARPFRDAGQAVEFLLRGHG